MTHMVDSLRKHQKMIILGVALGVIALYIVPVDQIVNALTAPPGLAGAHARIDALRLKVQSNTHIPVAVKAKIDSHLASLQTHLDAVLYKIQNT